GASPIGDPLGEQCGLGRLARAVAALEGDPEAGVRGHDLALAALAARVAAAFFAAAERAAALSASVFVAAVFDAADFDAAGLAEAFLAGVFLAGAFFAAAFFAGAFFAPRLGAGPLARLSASICTATSKVMSSGVWPRGMVTFVSPSVTYAPKRPSRMRIGLPLTGSASNSFSALEALRAPYLGCAYSSSACSS